MTAGMTVAAESESERQAGGLMSGGPGSFTGNEDWSEGAPELVNVTMTSQRNGRRGKSVNEN